MSNQVILIKDRKLGFGFLEKDEYAMRNKVFGDDSIFRHLNDEEIAVLEKNRNTCDDWNNILVADFFDPELIRNTDFYGKNRIGKMEKSILKYHDLELPVGIYNSRIISCDISDYCSIHDVGYLSHYIIWDYSILYSIKEMQCTNHAKFGNGIVKDFEDSSVRIDLSIMNENKGRAIAPFEDLICADAILWADKREDTELTKALWNLTDSSYPLNGGWYGEVGCHSVIKDCSIIKDVKFGSYCYVKGCNKLKNLTVKSSEKSPTQLGEGIELVNGIVGFGCHVFYGCKAVRFVMCENSSLKYGARLINSVLGDNSTVSCCEVLSNLVFPFHEQHHNNSFLISALIMGQSNMAAGANIGSNHNSRSADGEMRAGRGFWPALSSTLKYDSCFASFVIIAKGNYIHELNVKIPFALLSDNMKNNQREIMPAYWWMYNMYALERNCAKFTSRDKRVEAVQHIETDYLAPDTVSEIWDAVKQIHDWIKQSDSLDEVYAYNIEKSHTPVKILKVKEALEAYNAMLKYYAIKTVALYSAQTGVKVSELDKNSSKAYVKWTNLGGQLVPTEKLEKLKEEIKSGKFSNWKELHEIYDRWFEQYPYEKALHAMTVLKKVLNIDSLSGEIWEIQLSELVKIRKYIDEQVFITRKKDYDNPFRLVTYSCNEERNIVLGPVEDNEFVKKSSETTKKIINTAKKSIF